MGSINRVFLVGRLGRDPEDRRTGGGTRVSNFSLATDQYRSDPAGGAAQKSTEWHRVVAFGRVADQCNQYLRKGRLVCIEGSLQTRTWEKPPGAKHFSTEIVALRVTFLDARGDAPGAEADPLPAEDFGANAGERETEEVV
jgi:single-strand DNA-binding protein